MKKLTALLLCGLLLLPAGFAAAADGQSTGNTAVPQELHLLMELEIIQAFPDGELKLDKPLTRAELATIVSRLMAVDVSVYASAGAIYRDVPKTHWAAKEIYAVSQMGLMTGLGDSMFGPEETVTGEQTVKTLVSVLGYGIPAAQRGGFPAGYLAQAASIGLLSGGITTPGNEPMLRGDLYQMLTNSLEIDILLPDVIGGAENIYQKVKGRNLLSYYHKIYQIDDVVTKDERSALQDDRGTGRPGVVEIGGVEIGRGTTALDTLLGYRVECYYHSENDENTAVAVMVSSRNKVTEIQAENLVLDDDSFSMTNLVYYNERGSRSAVSVAKEADLIYNGVSYPAFREETLKIHSGSITVINNGGNGGNSVVLVEEYETAVLSSLDAEKGMIFDQSGLSYPYDSERTTVYLGDSNTTLDALQTDFVLSLYRAKSGDYMKIVASNRRVSGVVDEIRQEDGKPSLLIGEKEYQLVAGAGSGLLNEFGRIQVGDTVTLLLDVQGRIAKVADSADILQYAYLLRMNRENALDDAASLQLLDAQGQIVVKKTAANLRLNGRTKNASGKKYNADTLWQGPELIAGGAVIPQLLQCKFNAEGEVTAINTAQEPGVRGYNLDAFSKDKSGANMLYRAGTRSFANSYLLNASAPIFVVPTDEDGEFIQDKLEVKHLSDCIADQGYTLTFYDFDETMEASAAVSPELSRQSLAMYNATVITGIAQTLDEEGAPIKVAYGYDVTSSEIKEFMPKTEELFDDLKEGVVYRFVADVNGRVVSKSIIFDLTDDTNEYYHIPDQNAFGVGYSRDGDRFTIAIDEHTIRPYLCPADSRVFLYDASEPFNERSIVPAKMDDFVPTFNADLAPFTQWGGSKTFVFTVNAAANMVIIYR